jgi:hypothetical protein
MDKAVRHMARQSRATYAMFSLGIMLIKASTLIFIVNSFSVFVSVPAALLCSIIAFRSYTSEQVLNSIFHVAEDDVVSAAVVEHQEHHERHKAKRHELLARIPCVGGLLRRMEEVEMSVDDVSKDDRDNLANSHNSAADIDLLIARNQETDQKNNAAAMIQARGGSSVDASPVGVRPTAATDSVVFAELPPPASLQTDTIGRISRLCFGNFLDEVVGDFTSVAGAEAAAGRNNPTRLELAQR